MADQLADGRSFRTLNVLDDFNREGLNRPGFIGDCLVLLKRLYRLRSCLHSMPPQLRLV